MPPKGKGMSIDEKKQKVLDWLLKTGEIVSNKTLESTCAKATGVHSMIIKDIVGMLVGDDLVCQEKIGGSTYYWAFKSAKSSAAVAASEKADNENKKLKEEIAEININIKNETVGREDTPERQKLIKEITELKKKTKEIEQKIGSLKRNDPDLYLKFKYYIAVAVNQVNVWTDNAFQLRKLMTTKFNMEKKQTNQLLGINDSYDYLDDYKCPEKYAEQFEKATNIPEE